MDSTPLYQHTPSYFSKKNMIIAIVILILFGISYGTYRWYQARQTQAFDAWYAQQQAREVQEAAQILESLSQQPVSESTIQDAVNSLESITSNDEAAAAQQRQVSAAYLQQVEAEKRNQAMIEFKNNQ